MRIAVDITVLEQATTGVARVVLGLYRACARLDPTLDIAGIHRWPLACSLPPHFRDVPWGEWLPESAWRRLGPLSYAFLRRPNILHLPWNGGIVPQLPHCLRVATIHDVIPLAMPEMLFRTDEERRRYQADMQRSLDCADLVVTVSDASKRDILKHLNPRSEPVVIYPGTEFLDHLATVEKQRPQNTEYYIYQGGYHARKGLPELVRVHRELFRLKQVTHPLVLVGSPNHRIAPGFGLDVEAGVHEGAIVEKGYVSDDQLRRLTSDAIALIYPSHYEGFGMPLLEAMALGCPVISSNSSSMPEVCGDAAIYVSPGDEAGLAEAIMKIENGDGLRESLRKRGFAQASKFSWETSASKYLNELNKCIGTRG
jgi:glycosyltransferase involved in cell wall biosynthesis